MATRPASQALLLTDADAGMMTAVVSAASDIALVIDAQGVIREVSLGEEAAQDLAETHLWVGRRWSETVTVESRPKVLALIAGTQGEESEFTGPGVTRQVNHPIGGGLDLPVAYRVVPLRSGGRILALGRNLRTLAVVQQRLVDAQQSMERDYLRLRHAEARYRLLFEAVEEALVVVDVATLNVVEHNAAAARMVGDTARRMVSRPAPDLFELESQPVVQALFSQTRNAGRGEAHGLRLAGGAEVRLVGSLFKQDGVTLLLLRLVPANAAQARGQGGPSLLDVVNAMPDAFVLSDMLGRVLSANQAFVDMLQLPAGEPVIGQMLDRWLGRSTVDLNVLIGNLRQHGVLRLFPTTLRAGDGQTTAVEISAVAVVDGPQPCLGFTIRDVARRLPAEGRSQRLMPRSTEQLTGLVGRLPLRDIVGETTDLIERLCIEAALELTRDNRASAAEMLGLSRQSLYVKLRRFGIHDPSGGAAE
ncbi:transcriptional regulator PpsR [Pseudorhodoferax sp. Leaf274]|uniref:transcriptional regulator PpsR n=1 Tax=Pseudorhodoferax sp. Leaf274 TaxID=1736318 RepID=UPI0009EB9A8B|nr:transcriptional regulator PpsR [Pseudorhodoferax sp. Leaf274]